MQTVLLDGVYYVVPNDDNAFGLHSSPGGQVPHAGTAWDEWAYGPNYDWAKEQHDRYGARWLKVLGDGGEQSIMFCKALVDAGIMPVVRLYDYKPHPNYVADARQVAQYVAVGVRYFEFGNEPNLALEWAGMPDDGIVIGHHFVVALCNQIIANVGEIVKGGGVALLPALAPGNEKDDPEIVSWQSLIKWFQVAVMYDGSRAEDWFKIHVAAGNIILALHPRYGDHFLDDENGINLDYPNDPVHQDGRPMSALEIQRSGYNQAMVDVTNEERARNKQPGSTLADDSTCWRSWEFVDTLFYAWLKRHIAQMHTEAGPEVGDHWDGRYITVSRDSHARVALETIRRFNPKHPKAVPRWVLCQCFWVGWLWGHGSFLAAPWWDNPIHPDPSTGDRNLPIVYKMEAFAATENFDRWAGNNNEEDDMDCTQFGIPAELQALFDEWVTAGGIKTWFMRHALAVGGGPVTLPDLQDQAKGQASYSAQMIAMLQRYSPPS